MSVFLAIRLNMLKPACKQVTYNEKFILDQPYVVS